MKGFIFSLAGSADPPTVMSRGLHGVHQPGVPKPGESDDWRVTTWNQQMIATFADYATVRPGDLIFFFQGRLVYGIGRAIDPYDTQSVGARAAFLNYAMSLNPTPPDPNGAEALIGPTLTTEWRRVRVVVPFVASPLFFRVGIDMDEALTAIGPEISWGLRTWQGQSFKQLGEDETRELQRVFLRRFGNVAEASDPGPTATEVRGRFAVGIHQPLSIGDAVAADPSRYTKGEVIRQEFTLHGLLIEALDPLPGRQGDLREPLRLDVFREVAASPPKPPRWRDSIDLMATRQFDGGPATAIHYRLFEAKAGEVPGNSSPATYAQVVTQLMKYVDFVAKHHAGGNYSAVSAMYVAGSFTDELLAAHAEELRRPTELTTRSYVLNPRESPPTRVWREFAIATYKWNEAERRVNIRPLDATSIRQTLGS